MMPETATDARRQISSIRIFPPSFAIDIRASTGVNVDDGMRKEGVAVKGDRVARSEDDGAEAGSM
jgi:hypothetical protein